MREGVATPFQTPFAVPNSNQICISNILDGWIELTTSNRVLADWYRPTPQFHCNQPPRWWFWFRAI